MFNNKQLFYAIIPHILKAVIAIGVAIAIASFMGSKITTIGMTLNEKKAMTLALQKRSETTTTLREKLSIIAESDKRILDAFLTTENVLEFVTAVESIGNQNSMRQSLRFGTPGAPFAETNAITIIPVGYTITTSGTIATLSNYIKQFEELSYFVDIHSITITTGSPRGWEDSSSITTQGTLYTKKSS